MIKYINSAENAPTAIGPYSQATVAGPFAFLSGQVPIDPSTGKLVEGGIEEQTHQVMKNLKEVLSTLQLNFKNVAKTTILLSDLSHFQTVNEIYGSYLGETKPARATFQVAGLPLGAMIEIELIAQF